MKDLSEELKRMGMQVSSNESKEARDQRISKNIQIYRDKLKIKKPSELTLQMYRRRFSEAYFQVTGNAWNKQSEARGAIVQLAQWFSGEISMPNIKADKGIYLYGGFGTGKTSIMKAFNLMTNTRKFKMKSSKDIAKAYAGDNSLGEVGGYAAIKRYTDLTVRNGNPEGWMFDDLGAEKNMKHFGQEENVMADIMTSLYDKGHKGKVHVTSNLDPNQLSERYGERAASRMMEMFNFVHVVEKRDWRTSQ